MNTTEPHSPPAIKTRQQLEAVVENIAQMRLTRTELARDFENELEAVRQKYRPQLAEMERYLDMETAWVEKWARENPAALNADRTLRCEHATLGYRVAPPRIERATRAWTWSRIAAALADLPWGARYLRQPEPEVNKEALVADLPRLNHADLRNAGIRVAHGERFFVTPHNQPEPNWQEAA